MLNIQIMEESNKTAEAYGFLWRKNADILTVPRWHFKNMQEVIDEPIIRGSMGIDMGSGCGYDTYTMAKIPRSLL